MEQQLSKLLGGSEEGGRSVYSHLAEVFDYILKENPASLYSEFESISSFIKKNSFKYVQPSSDVVINSLPARSTPLTPWIKSCRGIFDRFKEQSGQSMAVYPPAPSLGVFSDLQRDADLFKGAGVSFGEEETYCIGMSLKKLMRSSGASEIRFWGKIYGLKKDYYVAEGVLAGAGKEDVQRPPGFELRGEGLNAHTYWVTSNVLADWVELPDLTPQHLQAARNIKKFFTGDLNAEVNSFPLFPGKERHYLRAQIARISAANVISPKGLFKTNEDDPNLIELEEEPALPGFEEIPAEETWVHMRAHILRAGRATHAEPEVEGEEVDVEEIKAKLLEDDPMVDRLRAINEDEPLGEEERPWVFTMTGDQQVYNMKPPAEGTVSYGTNVIRNKRWPGAFTVYKAGNWANLYLGFGHKSSDKALSPVAPPDVNDDPEDPYEQPEPTPLEAPDEVESDSEEEKKDDDEDDD